MKRKLLRDYSIWPKGAIFIHDNSMWKESKANVFGIARDVMEHLVNIGVATVWQ